MEYGHESSVSENEFSIPVFPDSNIPETTPLIQNVFI